MKSPYARRSVGRTVFGALAVVLAAAALTGCGSAVSGTPAAGEIDVRKLAVGNYPTDPLDVRMENNFGTDTGESGALARLADSVVTGPDVDPKFSHNVLSLYLRSSESAKYSSVLAGAVQPVLDGNGMMFGYSAAASTHALVKSAGFPDDDTFNPFAGAQGDPDATSFNVTVLQFPDAQQAQTAAVQMEAADFAVAADQNVHVTLDKQPDAKAHWRPGIPSLAATLAHGGYVVNVYVAQPSPDLDGLRKFADQVFAAQLPLLDQAPALSARDIFRMQYNPDPMLRRTLHPNQYLDLDAFTEITHTARGYLHYVDDQATVKRLLEDSGVDLVSTAKKGGLLFRARDAKSATTLSSGIDKLLPGATDPPAGVPDAACMENPNPKSGFSMDVDGYNAWNAENKYTCTVHYDRYVARVASNQLIDAQQKAAAQYAVLANSQAL
ncbi:hypothetical protein ACIP5Y_43415 [Nocardia sp. NPDC088792]|uniref:DUF7373 family lipoprotein n=1 Tax=Nocardia sp. NPDC088792 TaxID=3364332 RepID=UPI0037F10B48